MQNGLSRDEVDGVEFPDVLGRAWLMVAIAFLSQGVAYGVTFGMAGTFIGPAGSEFAASRLASSLGPSLVALLHGLLGPLVGLWIARRPVRPVMMLGALLMTTTFVVMHYAQSIWIFSLAYGLLGGAALSCLGMTPVTALVTRWFPERCGRALGVAFMPILLTFLPPAAAYLNVHYGWRTTALVAAGFALALLPLFLLVRDPPAQGATTSADPDPISHTGSLRLGAFRPDRNFWLLAAGVGIFDGSGIAIITHVIPYATDAGVDYQKATLLVSIMGVCGLVGAPTLGLLADRVGGSWALALVAVLLAIGWAAFLVDPPYAVMAASMALLGFCGGAFAALAGTALAQRYRGATLGPAVGLAVLVALPFNFVLPLLAGYLHDRTGGYQITFVYQIVLFAIALAMLLKVATARR